jgi:hypothetical protein
MEAVTDLTAKSFNLPGKLAILGRNRIRFTRRAYPFAQGRKAAPRSSATWRCDNPLVSAIRTASLRNVFFLPVLLVHLLYCTIWDQRSGTKRDKSTLSESYLDDGNRHAFDNAALTGLFLDFEAGRSKGQYDHQACLAVLRQGLKLDEVYGRLALRAEALMRAKQTRQRG